MEHARETFGQSPPQGGSDFDQSSRFTSLGAELNAAAPGSEWTGGAATAYGEANAEHQRVFGKLADLDKRIAQYVDQSAQVVAAGRQNLDAVRQWVTDAANSVPPGKQRDLMLMQVANKGLAELTEVVRKTNAESNAIAESLRKLGPEFDAIRLTQKLGNGPEDAEDEDLGDDEEQGNSETRPTCRRAILRRSIGRIANSCRKCLRSTSSFPMGRSRQMIRRQDGVEVKDGLFRRLRNTENVAVFEIDAGQAGKALVVDYRSTNPTKLARIIRRLRAIRSREQR